MEVFFEKNVVNENIDRHKKRNVVFNVIRIISIVILIVEIYFILSFQGIPVDQGAWAVVLSIFFVLNNYSAAHCFHNRVFHAAVKA